MGWRDNTPSEAVRVRSADRPPATAVLLPPSERSRTVTHMTSRDETPLGDAPSTDGTETDYRVGQRFRVVDSLPGVDREGERQPTGADEPSSAEWRVVATDDEERLLRFDEGEWYERDEVDRLVDEGSLEPLAGEGEGDAPVTLTAGARTYSVEPGLKFVADASFAKSHLTGTTEGPVEFVLVEVDDGSVRVAERTEEGYVTTNGAMSLSTLERGVELSDLNCVGQASVEERQAVADAAN